MIFQDFSCIYWRSLCTHRIVSSRGLKRSQRSEKLKKPKCSKHADVTAIRLRNYPIKRVFPPLASLVSPTTLTAQSTTYWAVPTTRIPISFSSSRTMRSSLGLGMGFHLLIPFLGHSRQKNFHFPFRIANTQGRADFFNLVGVELRPPVQLCAHGISRNSDLFR